MLRRISGATPLWREFMLAYLATVDKSENFVAPEKVKKMRVDGLTGMLPYQDYSSREEWFIKGTEPSSVSDWYQRIEICREDGRIANKSCKEADKTEVNTYVKIVAEIPDWQYSVDQWVYENYGGDLSFYPPEMESGLKFDSDGKVDKDADPIVKIVNIEDGDTIPKIFRLKIEVSTPNDVEVVRMYKNDEKFAEDKSDPYGYNFSFGVGDIGKEIKLKVTVEDSEGNKGDDEVGFKIGGF